ncbi:formate/nitrite transporter family protein [Micromonospora aurantiaca]|uniref:formate/nitrite transporter family protein n=1 Tax=Micromonospora aurantiaca (nom. illeg.) TaxID=47850 RepID=UPI0037A4EB24
MRSLLRLWGVTLAGNLVGDWLVAWLIIRGLPRLRPAAVDTGTHYAALGVNLRSFVLAVLAGPVITLMTWMQHATESLGVRLVPALLFGALLTGGQLFHSVLDSIMRNGPPGSTQRTSDHPTGTPRRPSVPPPQRHLTSHPGPATPSGKGNPGVVRSPRGPAPARHRRRAVPARPAPCRTSTAARRTAAAARPGRPRCRCSRRAATCSVSTSTPRTGTAPGSSPPPSSRTC